MTPNDWKILARYGVTPDNLSVGGSVYLRGTQITALPDNLSVGGWLDLSNTPITALPDDLSVGRSLHLSDTKIKPLYIDHRGYRLDRAGDYYHAGCRRFTAQEALEHWGHCRYPNLTRGAAYCRAIEAEEQRRKKGI